MYLSRQQIRRDSRSPFAARSRRRAGGLLAAGSGRGGGVSSHPSLASTIPRPEYCSKEDLDLYCLAHFAVNGRCTECARRPKDEPIATTSHHLGQTRIQEGATVIIGGQEVKKPNIQYRQCRPRAIKPTRQHLPNTRRSKKHARMRHGRQKCHGLPALWYSSASRLSWECVD